jgi:hypothetical protein
MTIPKLNYFPLILPSFTQRCYDTYCRQRFNKNRLEADRKLHANKNREIICITGDILKSNSFPGRLNTVIFVYLFDNFRDMKTITGTYHNGKLELDSPFESKKPVRVTLILEEEDSKQLKISDFSFAETQELLKDCTTSFSNEVIEERRHGL